MQVLSLSTYYNTLETKTKIYKIFINPFKNKFITWICNVIHKIHNVIYKTFNER